MMSKYFSVHFCGLGGMLMAYSTFLRFVNQRFPLIKFKNEGLEARIRNGAPEPSPRTDHQETINLPPNSSLRSDTQISRNMSKSLKIGDG